VHADTVHADTVHADTVHADTMQADTMQADTVHADTVHDDTMGGTVAADAVGVMKLTLNSTYNKACRMPHAAGRRYSLSA
jgi:hypothetical protein